MSRKRLIFITDIDVIQPKDLVIPASYTAERATSADELVNGYTLYLREVDPCIAFALKEEFDYLDFITMSSNDKIDPRKDKVYLVNIEDIPMYRIRTLDNPDPIDEDDFSDDSEECTQFMKCMVFYSIQFTLNKRRWV